MSTSETITKNDLANILNEIGTSVPYEDTGAIQLVNGIKYRRKNGIVFVDCYIGNGTTMTTSYQTLGTLPEGYRPLETQYAPMGINNANVGVAYVSDAGVIGAKTFSGTTTYYWFHFAYPVAQNALFDEKVDYIVEQGTSNGWSYRKWNSGFAECWYFSFSKESVAFTAWGGLYYADVATGLNFPFTWSAAPIVYLTPYDSQAGVFGNWNVTTTGVGTIRFIHNTNNSTTVRCHIYVKGRWK